MGREQHTQPLANTVLVWMAVLRSQATRLSLMSDLCPGTYKKDYHMQTLTNLDYKEGKIKVCCPLKIFPKEDSSNHEQRWFPSANSPCWALQWGLDAVRITDVVIFFQPFENNSTNPVTPIWCYQKALGYEGVISDQPMRAWVGNVFPSHPIWAMIHKRMVLIDG